MSVGASGPGEATASGGALAVGVVWISYELSVGVPSSGPVVGETLGAGPESLAALSTLSRPSAVDTLSRSSLRETMAMSTIAARSATKTPTEIRGTCLRRPAAARSSDGCGWPDVASVGVSGVEGTGGACAQPSAPVSGAPSEGLAMRCPSDGPSSAPSFPMVNEAYRHRVWEWLESLLVQQPLVCPRFRGARVLGALMPR